ncbi:MAG: FG-GAP-like repeat-containing protein [candidate division WOR-3 bacterium]|nr:FG-GAP-like repeat-containing protein [candidate division WOR-3 bacterium]
MCDWNNDHRLDLITGERLGYFTVFLRTDSGTLTNAGRIQAHGADIMTSNNSWPTICDWNRDGRKDLLVGQEGIGQPCNVYVYLNEGTDSLSIFGDSTPVLHSGTPFNDYRCVPVLEDLDRDGRRDLVLGEWYSSVRFYQNVGTDTNPAFTNFVNLVQPDPDSFLNGNPPRVNFTDWDGDGDMDMITCDYYGSVFLRRNITATGVEQTMNDGRGTLNVGPTIVCRVLNLQSATCNLQSEITLLDAAGRTVMALKSGANDVSRLSPGVYFVRAVSREPSAVSCHKVVVQR